MDLPQNNLEAAVSELVALALGRETIARIAAEAREQYLHSQLARANTALAERRENVGSTQSDGV